MTPAQCQAVLPTNRIPQTPSPWPTWDSTLTSAQNVAAQQTQCNSKGYCFDSSNKQAAWCFSIAPTTTSSPANLSNAIYSF
jgi:hypothetical protein